MAAITLAHAQEQLSRFEHQLNSLDKIKTTVDQRRLFVNYYNKEINFWQSWVDRLEQMKVNEIEVIFEEVTV